MLQTKKNLYATALVARLSMELASQTILYRKNPAPSSRANYSLLFFIFSSVALRGGCLSVSLQKKKKRAEEIESWGGAAERFGGAAMKFVVFQLLRVWLTPVELVVFLLSISLSSAALWALTRAERNFQFSHSFICLPSTAVICLQQKNTWKYRLEVRTMQSQRIILCARHRLLLGCCQFPTCLRCGALRLPHCRLLHAKKK